MRERLKAGDSDTQVIDFLVARYGDFVLLNPPVKPTTWLLWFGPLAVVTLAGLGLWAAARRRARAPAAPRPTPLSAAEQAELDRLLGDDTADSNGASGNRAGPEKTP